MKGFLISTVPPFCKGVGVGVSVVGSGIAVGVAISGLGLDKAAVKIPTIKMKIITIAMFLLVCDGFASDGGVAVGNGMGAVMDVPQFMQNFELGGSSFPHLEQNCTMVAVLFTQYHRNLWQHVGDSSFYTVERLAYRVDMLQKKVHD